MSGYRRVLFPRIKQVPTVPSSTLLMADVGDYSVRIIGGADQRCWLDNQQRPSGLFV